MTPPIDHHGRKSVQAASNRYARGATRKEFSVVRERKRAVLWYLAHHKGELRSRSGMAVRELMEAVAPLDDDQPGLTAFSHMLVHLEVDGLVRRDVNGRRTLAVALVPTVEELRAHPRYGVDPWQHRQSPDLRIVDRAPQPATHVPLAELEEQREEPPADDDRLARSMASDGFPASEAAADEWQPPTVALNADPHNLLSAAMAYIAQAMSTSRPVAETDPAVLRRLSDTLEDNQRLRRKLDAANDEMAAVKGELSGLRRAKQALEENLRTIANGRLDEPALRRFRELDRLVRTAPGSAKGE